MVLNVATTTVTAKEQAFARQIAEDLTIRVAPAGTILFVVSGLDSSGFPTITLSHSATPVAGEQNAFIRVTSVGTFNKDSLGLNQNVYSPTCIQLVLESTTSGITGAGLSLLSMANFLEILPEVLQFGTRVELYLVANGAAPSVAGITGVPAQVWDNLYQPLTSSM